MAIKRFFQKRKEKIQIDKILDKVQHHQQAHDLVNKAISYRSIKEFVKSIQILEDVLEKFPSYFGAHSIYANTLRMIGKYDDAAKHLKGVIKKYSGNKEYSLIEIWANLGAIYFIDKKDIDKALPLYKVALHASKPERIDEDSHELMLSSVHRDLAMVFFEKEDYPSAKKHALARLNIRNECPIASKFYGLSLINEFLCDNRKMQYFIKNIENDNIVKAIKHLKVAISEDSTDYASINGIALAFCSLLTMPYYNSDPNIKEEINEEHDRYLSILDECSKKSEHAKYYLDMYDEIAMNLGIEILQHQHPGIVIEKK